MTLASIVLYSARTSHYHQRHYSAENLQLIYTFYTFHFSFAETGAFTALEEILDQFTMRTIPSMHALAAAQ